MRSKQSRVSSTGETCFRRRRGASSVIVSKFGIGTAAFIVMDRWKGSAAQKNATSSQGL